MSLLLTAFGRGLGLGAGLITAIGAQNAFVLRQGLKREGRVTAALVCTLCDASLIALGVGGFGTLIARVPVFTHVAAWMGALFLLFYGPSPSAAPCGSRRYRKTAPAPRVGASLPRPQPAQPPRLPRHRGFNRRPVGPVSSRRTRLVRGGRDDGLRALVLRPGFRGGVPGSIVPQACDVAGLGPDDWVSHVGHRRLAPAPAAPLKVVKKIFINPLTLPWGQAG